MTITMRIEYQYWITYVPFILIVLYTNVLSIPNGLNLFYFEGIYCIN